MLNDTRDAMIRRRYSQGFLVSRIADDFRISTQAVRRSLARTAPTKKLHTPNPVKEAKKLIAEGYDPDVVMANFGDLMK